jgi:hypothetical protein
LTGSTLLSGEWAYDRRNKEIDLPKTLPLVREFRRRTAASSFPTPRKRRFETGGGKYRTYWSSSDFSKESMGVTMFAYEFAKALGRKAVPQGFMTMSSGHGGRNRQLASPLSWTSFRGVKDVKNPMFEERLNELFLQYPGTAVAKQALSKHILDVKSFVAEIINGQDQGKDPSIFALQAPAFPEAGRGDDIASDTIPTYAYNWNVSPLTPMGVAGVIWVPSESNIGENASEYATELEIYAKSLPETYEQGRVPFFYAHPTSSLVEGITFPRISGSEFISFSKWPKSLKEIAISLGAKVK